MGAYMSGTNKRNSAKKLLGELLVEAGMINEFQLAVALGQQRQWGGRLGMELIRLGFIEEQELAFVLQEQLGIKWISLHDRKIPDDVTSFFPADLAKKYNVMPVEISGNSITIATRNPNDMETMDAISFAVGKKVRPVMALEYDIRLAISRYYEPVSPEEKKLVVETGPPKRSPQRLEQKKSDTNFSRDHLIEKLKMRSPMAQEALIRVLMRKGYFTKEEFFRELQSLD
jgi:hypothetical protein